MHTPQLYITQKLMKSHYILAKRVKKQVEWRKRELNDTQNS